MAKIFNRNVEVAPSKKFKAMGVGSSVVDGIVVGAQQALTDAGAVNLTSFNTTLTTTGAAAVTLADGQFVGQRKRIQMIVDAGDATLTPSNLQGGSTITFADVGDVAELVWENAGWRAIALYNIVDGATAPALA